MAKEKNNRACFVIAPIGKDDSDIRVRSDEDLEHIISHAAKQGGYEPAPADEAAVQGAWAREIERRARRALSGESKGEPWEDVRGRIARNLAKR